MNVKSIEMLDIFNTIPDEVKNPAIKAIAGVFGKILAEAGLEQIKNAGKKLTDGTKDLFSKEAKQYFENYTNRHGNLKVLGMPKPVSLDSVYTKVNFKNDLIRKYSDLDSQQELFRTRNLKDEDDEKRAGMEVANETPYLMILGHPGTGKSTFLKKVGLEALKRGQGDYQHSLIPVLLELRKFSKKSTFDFVAEIAEEFKNCGLSDYGKATEKLLKNGELLILLDGLDEVPSDRLSDMITVIGNLVDQFSQNRFIVSCRIATYRNYHSFQRFTDAVIANFDDEEIESFINKWFTSHNQPEWGEDCWKALKNSDNQAIEELTRTPLLLTLLCILFNKKGGFPHTRTTLYEKAITTLLEEWDASKKIIRNGTYKGLDTKCKEILLAEIAYQNFITNNLFFPKSEIATEIENTLKDMNIIENNPQYIDGKSVLRDIEAQHGILIERDEDIYSFSHLTLQEFLTAKKIIDDDEIDLQTIVNEHIFDLRWREVFLILSGLKKADNLLKFMKQKTDSLVNENSKLQQLLNWAENIINPSEGEIKAVAKRAIAIANALANSPIALANANAYAYAYVLLYSYEYSNYETYANALANALANAILYANGKVTNYTRPYAQAYAKYLTNIINYLRISQQYQIYQDSDFSSLITKLEQLKTDIDYQNGSNWDSQLFSQKMGGVVLQLQSSFRLTSDLLDLSESDLKIISDYLLANRLIIKCKESARQCSQETWDQIESQMLLISNTNNFG